MAVRFLKQAVLTEGTICAFPVDARGLLPSMPGSGGQLITGFNNVYLEYQKDILTGHLKPGWCNMYVSGSFHVALMCVIDKVYGPDRDDLKSVMETSQLAIDDLMDWLGENYNKVQIVSPLFHRRLKISKDIADYIKQVYPDCNWVFETKGG